MKKALPIIIILGVLLLGAGGFFLLRGKKAPPSPDQTPGLEEIPRETPLEKRPYATLTPRTDGKEFTLTITGIKNAETVEYELVYLAEGLSRGVVGAIDLEGEEKVIRKLLLGTCSRNVCKYDEGIEKGTLTLRLRGSEGAIKFVSDFHLQKGDVALTSIDEKFKVEGGIPGGNFYITMSTIGLPGEAEGKVVGGPYGIFSSGSQTIKEGRVYLTLAEEAKDSLLYSWQNSLWQEELKGHSEKDGVLEVQIENLGTFIAVAGVSENQ